MIFKSALVTGGAGFIGSHVVDSLLAEGLAVCAIDDLSSGRLINLKEAQDSDRFEFVQGDFREASKLCAGKSFDLVVHLAAQTSVTASVKDPFEDLALNAEGTLRLLKDSIRQGAKSFVYTNTAGALYGETQQIPTTEDHPLRPDCPYGVSKLYGENILRAIASSLHLSKEKSQDPSHEDYFSWASLRLANVYGPRQVSKGEAGVVPIFYEAFEASRKPTVFGDGSVTRDYVHVADVASAFTKICRKLSQGSVNDVFNVGTSVETPTQDLYKKFRETLLASPTHQNKKALLDFVGSASKPGSGDLRPGEICRSAVSYEKLKKFSGWSPELKLEDGLRQTIESLGQH